MFFFLDIVLSVPFNGVLVRYRAASHSKASVEDGSVPPPPTFIGMAKRVWKLQGVEGLSKGLMPTLMGGLLFTFLFPWGWFKIYFSPSAPVTNPTRVSLLASSIYALIYTMVIVTIYRAIVTPRKLDVLNAREALHILFSAHERHKFWAIYQIPGLLPAIFINLGFNHLILSMREPILPWWQQFSPLEYSIRTACLIVVALLNTIVSAPLEVIVTRLAIQRNYGGLALANDSMNDIEPTVPPAAADAQSDAALDAVPQTQTAPETSPKVEQSVEVITEPFSEKASYPDIKSVETSTIPVAAAQVVNTTDASSIDLERGLLSVDFDNIVVHLRNENGPYLGFVDCAKKIIAEEGWPTLYRMWFLTFLGAFFM
ncbi:hypothetical protein C8F04DRAFT_1113452 [Mycena alexandri]|uniref:Uncharacterized protein n=1 Tax=Mycena alexandri TaxID=1745969 RepID=A0AAD6X0K0_9AGAR|nr:hypothetical protein C8F04DRAFT_1113452 [Mycena alexandri]